MQQFQCRDPNESSRQKNCQQSNHIYIYIKRTFFRGWTALEGLGLLIVQVSRSHSETPHSVGILWTSDWPFAETSLFLQQTQHSKEKDIHDPDAIRNHNTSKRAAAEPPLRPRGHWHWRTL